jgi:hypothetical protein
VGIRGIRNSEQWALSLVRQIEFRNFRYKGTKFLNLAHSKEAAYVERRGGGHERQGPRARAGQSERRGSA